MLDAIAECEEAAYEDGLAAGLAVALAGTDGPAPPGRVAALPTAALAPGAPVIRHRMADLEGIAFVRRDGTWPAPAPELTAFGARLGAARIGVTRRLTDLAVHHLSGRTSGGEPMIRKQLVAGVLADLVTAAEALRRCLEVAGHLPVAVTDVHDRLTVHDREAAKLLGASGFLAGSPARAAHVSRLTANCWIARDGDS
ncbi:acyl-CoA dehydrogenase [Streptomyces sp. SID4919]|uniref:acyl-CoA dehydrogenase family protein n=1 Tax=unclassified Streptomyces TaxID=2593676 RepID=UPI000823C74F|nr:MULTISPECIES: acyl-CoA dehydrogenase family protein [unclassified Streptomyces]MYY08078.1 acyl-CoA dehydrogenase [Streptomyces sp. SID4919]SCK08688.1 Acyl-CoA dehydrogenase, C-terminal domain [Streptomyces sp. AmelKG-E11A]